jgi:di/tricarboxylate transporter
LEIAAPLITPGGTRIEDTGVTRAPLQVDTHLRVKLLMLLVIAVAVFLFIVEWVRVDVVAILMMVLLPELGLIEATDTFRGLSSNAVVAIIGVMIISFGLNRVGIVGRLTRPLVRVVGGSATRLIVIFSSLIAVISSVMQNTGAAVLFLPGIRIGACKRLHLPLSRVLMPIGMAAILGGTLTMVGTSPLILLNDLLPKGMAKFGLLELTPIGFALVVFGIAYLSLAAKVHLRRPGLKQDLPDSAFGADWSEQYEEISGPFEILVPDGFQAGTLPQEIVRIRRERQVNIVAMGPDDRNIDVAPPPGSAISASSSLLVYGAEAAVEDFVRDYRLVRNLVIEPTVAGVVEVVISPRSTMIGKTIGGIGFRATLKVSTLALHQRGKTYYKELADRPLQAGDAILIHGTWQQLHSLQEHHQNFIFISRRETEFQKPEKAMPALICFFTALVLMLFSSLYLQTQSSYNPLPLSICLMIGAIGMILSRVMTITEAYRAVDWRTVFLLGGLIPLGMAVSQTGTAEWIANGLIGVLGENMPPLLLLFVLAVLSCGFTLVISNVGACALLVPLGVSMAIRIGMDPRVAAIVVGLGVSNSFILPTHQVNALYMGPGEYRTVDYIKIGGILSLIYIVVLVLVTYFLYL